MPGDAGLQYCCPGCALAHDLVAGLGLDKFYALRQLDPAARALKPDDSQAGLDLSRHVHHGTGEGQSEISLVVEGYQCAACGWLIEQVLNRDERVASARVNMTTHRLRVVWPGAAELADDILAPILKLGYRLFPFDADLVEESRARRDRELLRAMAVAGFAAANVMLLSVSIWAGYGDMGPATRGLLHWVSALIALPAVVYAGWPFFRSGFTALAAGRVNMDVPITLAVVLTSAMSLFQTITGAQHVYFDSAVGLLFFLLIGRYLDSRTRSRARASAAHLLALTAKEVTVVDADGRRRRLSPEAVAVGMIVAVAAGERIGVDGRIAKGRSEIDQSLLTGESLRLGVAPGDSVSAGTLNTGQPLEIVATATGEGTALAEIVRLMEQAEQGRARFVDLAERIARLYAPVVHGLGAVTFIGWMVLGVGWQTALLHAIAVLIITCPCALALAVPAVQVVAASRLMRSGVLLKSATALERLALADTVVFDKTGTLTLGQPVLQAGVSPQALALAAGLAAHSRHPLSRALVRAAGVEAVQVDADAVTETPGLGLVAQIEGREVRLGSRKFCAVADASGPQGPELWLKSGHDQSLRFSFEDQLRPDAAVVVNDLKSLGCKVEILSGDRHGTVEEVAQSLGLADFRGEADPAEKHRVLGQRAASGRRVLMVGDGLNDAPSLAAAFVSMSPASAADISQTASDAVFQGTRLAPVLETIITARRAQSVIRQNLAFAFLYNAITIPFAVAGLVTPLFAAVAMSSSSILVIANALRLGLQGRRATAQNRLG